MFWPHGSPLLSTGQISSFKTFHGNEHSFSCQMRDGIYNILLHFHQIVAIPLIFKYVNILPLLVESIQLICLCLLNIEKNFFSTGEVVGKISIRFYSMLKMFFPNCK